MKHEPFHRSKFLLALIAILFVVGSWRWAIFHLYSVPEPAIPAFQAITTQMMWAVTAIALTLAGVKGVQQMLSQKFEAAASAVSQAVVEHKEQKAVTEIHADFQTKELIERYDSK